MTSGPMVKVACFQTFFTMRRAAVSLVVLIILPIIGCLAQEATEPVKPSGDNPVLSLEGDPEALYFRGIVHAGGHGEPKNAAFAVLCWRKAAEQGHAASQCALGMMYANGLGVPT